MSTKSLWSLLGYSVESAGNGPQAKVAERRDSIEDEARGSMRDSISPDLELWEDDIEVLQQNAKHTMNKSKIIICNHQSRGVEICQKCMNDSFNVSEQEEQQRTRKEAQLVRRTHQLPHAKELISHIYFDSNAHNQIADGSQTNNGRGETRAEGIFLRKVLRLKKVYTNYIKYLTGK